MLVKLVYNVGSVLTPIWVGDSKVERNEEKSNSILRILYSGFPTKLIVALIDQGRSVLYKIRLLPSLLEIQKNSIKLKKKIVKFSYFLINWGYI